MTRAGARRRAGAVPRACASPTSASSAGSSTARPSSGCALGHALGGRRAARPRRGRLQGDRLAAPREGLSRVGRRHHARGHAVRGGARLRRQARQGRLRRPRRARGARRARAAACAASTLADPRSVALGSEPVRVGGELVGRVTSGGYGYTVGASIAYAYLPAEHDVGTEVEVEIFGEWVAGRRRRGAALRPGGRADPRMTDPARSGGRARLARTAATRLEMLGGGITNHNVKVTRPDGARSSCASPARTRTCSGSTAASSTRPPRPQRRSASARRSSPSSSRRAGSSRASSRATIPPAERMREPEHARAASRAALRAVHAGPPIPGSSTRFASSRPTATTAFDRGATRARRRTPGRDELARADRGGARPGAPERPCHNDLLNANFIDDGERLRIVDWEYAGMGDPFFDLANFAINHELDADARRGAARRLLRRRARRRARAGARADALHVRLPRGDVGRGAERRVGARLRLRRLRGGALRAAWSARPPSRAFRAALDA